MGQLAEPHRHLLLYDIVRTFNANNNSKDLLAAHYAAGNHHASPEATPLAAYFWNPTS